MSSVPFSDIYLRSIFSAVDTDRSGELELDELCEALSVSSDKPFPVDAARKLLRMYDVDGDGSVQFPEFRSLYIFLHSIEEAYKTAVEQQAATQELEGLSAPYVRMALQSLNLEVPQDLFSFYCKAFQMGEEEDDPLLDYTGFFDLAVTVQYIHFLFDKIDYQGTGRLVVDETGLFSLGLWLH